MTLRNPINSIISQAITSAVDGALAKHQHKQRDKDRTTQIFGEDDEDDVLSNNLSANTNSSQNLLHELEEPHDQVRDFVGAPIYDDYDDNFCREPCHKSDMMGKEEDMSLIDIHEINGNMTRETHLDRPIVTSNVGSYYVPITNLTDEPIYDVSDDEVFIDSNYCRDPLFIDEYEVQGSNKGGDFHVVVDDGNICVRKEHIDYGLREKDCPQHLRRKPPDRDQNKETSYVGTFETQERRSIGSTYTKLLEETGSVLKLDHGHHDCLRTENGLYRVITASQLTGSKDINLAATYLDAKSMVAHLRVCERSWKYDGGTLYDGLGVTPVSFRGIQGPLFSREKTMDPVLPNKEIVHLYTPICLDKLVVFQTVAKLSGEVSFMDVMFVIYPTSSTWLVYFSRGSLQNFVILGVDMSYCRHQHVCAIMHSDNLFLEKKKQQRRVNLLPLMGSVMFYVRDLKAIGKDEQVKVQIITCLVSLSCLRSCRWSFRRMQNVKWIFEWVRQENKLCWSFIFRATVSHVDLSVDLIKVEFERVRSYLYFVAYSRCVLTSFSSDVVLVFKYMVEHRFVLVYSTISSPIRGKHKHLDGRIEAFDMIQFVWVFGAYKTVTFLELQRSIPLWTLCIHFNVVSIYGILRSSAVWPLSHMDVTVPLVVFPSQWPQIELQWGVSKRKVEVVHSPHTGLGCIFVALICWSDFSCESRNLGEYPNSDFQRVCEAATYFPVVKQIFSPSSRTKFSMVMWAMTRSVGHKLICGVVLKIFKSTHRLLPNKNTRNIFLNDVTRCTFYVGWDLIHSVEVSSENLDLRDKVFHRRLAIYDGELQLVQQKKSVWVAYQCGSRTFFVIKEGKMFSLVRQSWSSLALGSAYPTVHLLPSVSSLHQLHLRVFKREFDIVLLMNLEFVVVILAAISEQVDVTVVHVQSPTVQTKKHA
ncbi:hypothetical protein IGI04_006146 [Brassica rapa subsp. trilocularis]|uniref:Uncharacterized protein n=1 Tax=Brassica rapa subsp. trilocularis TaxID=1813537 RepID=A0ABQ7NG02_BRACM|nr:hypothetical protein IGI04_006146 [Brassica rapa subsp. trilocularis]